MDIKVVKSQIKDAIENNLVKYVTSAELSVYSDKVQNSLRQHTSILSLG